VGDTLASIPVSLGQLDSTSSRFDRIKPVALLGLILAEGMSLGISFDSDSLAQLPHGWWSVLLSRAGEVMPLAAVLATGTILLAARKVRGAIASAPRAHLSYRNLLLLFAHLACFATLFVLSSVLFGVRPTVRDHPTFWVAAWLSCAGLTGISWLTVLFPPRVLVVIVRNATGPILASVAIGALAWIAGQFTQQWWSALQSLTLNIAYAILRLGDPSAWVNPAASTIGAGKDFGVEVSYQCSGYEGVGLITVFLAGYFWVFRTQLRFPQVLLLLPSAIAAVFVANAVRIAALVGIGGHFSSAIALGGFHSFAGVLLVSIIALATARVAQRSPYFCKIPANRSDAGPNPAAPWLVPFLAVLLAGLITGLFSASAFDRLYFVRVLVAGIAIWHYRKEYRRIDRRITAIPVIVGVAIAALWIVPLGHTAHDVAARPDLSPVWFAFWIVFRVVGSVLSVPIVEELAFRGYLARRLTSRDFSDLPMKAISGTALFASSIVFAALHHEFIPGLITGIGYAWLAKWSNRLGDAIVAHAVTNACLCYYILTSHAWWLWS
jgi:exosortase E/protease (VPEID-CTERM system)